MLRVDLTTIEGITDALYDPEALAYFEVPPGPFVAALQRLALDRDTQSRKVGELEATEREKTLLHLRVHIRECPIGWVDGTPITHRGTTDAEIVAWFQRLKELAGV